MYVENLLLNNDQMNIIHHKSKLNQIDLFYMIRKVTITEVK
jgi:hypothetical protein